MIPYSLMLDAVRTWHHLKMWGAPDVGASVDLHHSVWCVLMPSVSSNTLDWAIWDYVCRGKTWTQPGSATPVSCLAEWYRNTEVSSSEFMVPPIMSVCPVQTTSSPPLRNNGYNRFIYLAHIGKHWCKEGMKPTGFTRGSPLSNIKFIRLTTKIQYRIYIYIYIIAKNTIEGTGRDQV